MPLMIDEETGPGILSRGEETKNGRNTRQKAQAAAKARKGKREDIVVVERVYW